MKHIIGLVIGVLVLFISTQVWAQVQVQPQGMYLSGNIGFGIRLDADISASGGPFSPFENDPAFVVHGAIGFELNPTIRFEGEIGLHANTADIAGSPGRPWLDGMGGAAGPAGKRAPFKTGSGLRTENRGW